MFLTLFPKGEASSDHRKSSTVEFSTEVFLTSKSRPLITLRSIINICSVRIENDCSHLAVVVGLKL